MGRNLTAHTLRFSAMTMGLLSHRPQLNYLRNLDDIPKDVRDEIEFIPVTRVDAVLKVRGRAGRAAKRRGRAG